MWLSLGSDKLKDVANTNREQLYQVLDQVRGDLVAASGSPLDSQLTELWLNAYYPQGGFYRRHRAAVHGSALVLQTYTVLLYLNKDWTAVKDKGELRVSSCDRFRIFVRRQVVPRFASNCWIGPVKPRCKQKLTC